MSTDAAQIILIAVIIVLTALLAVLGVQIFFILRESSQTLKRVNKILDGASGIVGNAAFFNNPLVKVLAGTALAFLAGKKKIKEVKVKEKVGHLTIQRPKVLRRFFRRSVR